ncbi:ABC transporter ATP-binding protein [Paenibacillus antri]|uniref:ABC transporter ATP-binding protein n=1 Tax=Paenibacillus antri TaxID=2582848 RepID=A0A5R9GG06_9BACL|nr:ABC transporter ATP-binding protein [Paenibacillus antri]TLS52318.1 ABC transporter ATP-binding protein [Paenibacillus antri]
MIKCENLVKIYKTSDLEVVALQGLDLTIEQGELTAIIGNSGSGKSTLLNMLGGLDRPSAGRLWVDGKDMLKFSERELTRYKKETVGFVWQNKARNLIPYLTARENVEIPILLKGRRKRLRAMELLEAVGMSHRRDNRLDQLSGGEQQRVAIAIALANHPKLLLADEPTGSVDTKTAALIMELFNRLNQELGLTIVIVTHDQQLAKQVSRVVAIRDGRTSSELVRRASYAERLAEMEQEAATTSAVEDSHEEYVVMDGAGRIQVPANYLEALGLAGSNRIKLQLEGDRIVMTSPAGKPEA